MTAIAERRKKTKVDPEKCTDSIHQHVRELTRPSAAKSKRLPSHPQIIVEAELQTIELKHLVNHPSNPDPSPADVAETAEWLKQRGQEEPLVVRPDPTDGERFQILAGKRRFAAATSLGWTSLQCRVRHDLADDKAAVAYIAASNAQRHAETPIRQALMLRAMLDAGATEEEAGAVYGLQSASGVRGKLQLLKLPPVWQERVVSGEILETAARCLVPYAELAPVMAAINTAYQVDKESDFDADQWLGRDGFETCVRDVVMTATRPVEKGRSHNYGHELGYTHECYIRRTTAIDDELGIVPLPLGANGKSIFVATNVERYDDLQLPLIKAKLAKQNKTRHGTGDDSKDTSKERTPAQQKEFEREQDEQLAKRIRRWRHEWLRFLIASKLRQKVPDHPAIITIVVWCLSQEWNWAAHRQLNVKNIAKELPAATPQNLLELICRILLVPEKNPDYPVWPFEFVDQLATDLGVDLTDAWLMMQSIGGGVSSLESFYTLHNSRQLRALAGELGCYVAPNVGKSAAINVLLAVERHVPLPKSIEPLGKKTRKAK